MDKEFRIEYFCDSCKEELYCEFIDKEDNHNRICPLCTMSIKQLWQETYGVSKDLGFFFKILFSRIKYKFRKQ